MKIWFMKDGMVDKEDLRNRCTVLEERAEKAEKRIQFLEEKYDPRIQALLAEATELEMEPKHINTDYFSWKGEEYPAGLRVGGSYVSMTYVPAGNEHWGCFDSLQKAVDTEKLKRYEVCRKKKKC